ncbi:SAF domain-containing protein [Novosphingobium sp. CF614]|uniref:UxaA family hydrolase n=1 Tax=Novosphingobium sp. CF614 TaxID=1884364 RepID=UPI0008F16B50|nr:UxaA family hydrolase [Novosphingobium sp. CF614]SFF72994.1 SAF domain-containing protein [Novosphingobium sp. CF614]
MGSPQAEEGRGAFLLLDPADNVLICTRDAAEGDTVAIDGIRVRLSQPIRLGHKIARQALRTGEKVLRYGAPIGSMTADAAIAEHVHSHNLASDYIPAHGRGGDIEGANI